MNTAGRLSAYGVALVLVAGGAWGVGSAVGPMADSTESAAPAMAEHGENDAAPADEEAGHGDTHSDPVAEADLDQPEGLASSRGGYTLTPTSTMLTPGTPTPLSFQITGPDGAPVTAFDVEHEKQMHLIVVRRDTAGFQHVHPEMAADGTWTVPFDPGAPGSYRAFADFKPTGGEAVTLGVDLSAPGDFQPATYTESETFEVDGYEVSLHGHLDAGSTAELTVTVRKDGQPVTDLEPYLGAYGHLVALRGGDLAYLHVHPEGTPGDGVTPAGPDVTFFAEVPTAGTYRLFLDFQHGGVVRTAEFTLSAEAHS
jgi:hypothetical protein